MKSPKCPHCKRNKPAHGRRGLCWGCSRTPAIRAVYPADERYVRRGTGTANLRELPAPEPTTALTGTEEKIAVLAARVAAGLDLWHPGDAEDCGAVLDHGPRWQPSPDRCRVRRVAQMG
jgi:hypothetical protein